MESERFDALTRKLGNTTNRRTALKGLLGVGVATIGGTGLASEVDAARRGFSGPKWPSPEPCIGDCSAPCNCGPNDTCIGGLCFAPCANCACDGCTYIQGMGSFCTYAAYDTEGSCAGQCEAGYACAIGSLCMRPCQS